MQLQKSPLVNIPMVEKANMKVNKVNMKEKISSYYKLLSGASTRVSADSMMTINSSIKKYGSITNDSNTQIGKYYYRLLQLTVELC